jgi:hypothetical protein
MVGELVTGLDGRDRALQTADHIHRDDLVNVRVVHERGVVAAREKRRRAAARNAEGKAPERHGHEGRR